MNITIDFLYIIKTAVNKFLNGIKYAKYIMGILLFVVFLVITGIFAIKDEYINRNILCMASNIRQAEKTKTSKEDLMSMAVNSNSPFLNENKNVENVENKGIEKAEKNKKQDKEDFDVSVVDVVDVFSKKTEHNLQIKETTSAQTINVYGMSISNYSSKKNIDILNLFEKNIVLTKKSDPILIYSTHTSESYTNSERYKFDYSSTYRTRDAKYNMLSVGKVLSDSLKENDMQVIFDTTPHDYGSYEIAYTNSRKTIQNAISNNQRIGLAIDVHRDALGDLTNGPTVEINGKKVAKLMFVMGVGTDSYTNEYWEENLALALQLQKLGEEMYPGLFRGMIIRNSKYNQDLIKHSFLIEVGTTGNTLEESYFAARCLANILNKFYNN